MTLILAANIDAGIAIANDSALEGRKAVVIGNIALAWFGDFHRSPLTLCMQDEPEYFDPAKLVPNSSLKDRSDRLQHHLNDLDHVHGGRAQAGILVFGFEGLIAKVIELDASGGKGSWQIRSTPHLPLAAGCLEPFEIKHAVAPFQCAAETEQQFEMWATERIGFAHSWLAERGDPRTIGHRAVVRVLPS